MDQIQTIEDIQKLAVQGFRDWKRFGNVNVKVQDDLLIFNYSQMAQFEARWNFFEQVSRGLIINHKTGEIVARAFDKFFNWLEGGRKARGHIVLVTEKVDGSLGVLYRTEGGYKIATRGNFGGDQAEWATKFLNENYDLTELAEDLTLLFEIVYPANRIVVDYKEREDLILLAARNRNTGTFLPFFPDVYTLAHQFGFALPQVYTFSDLTQIIEQTGLLNVNQEGYVVEFSDGSRFKFKGDRYVEMQRLITGLTFKNVVRAMSSGSLHHILDVVPDEFLTEVKQWMKEIQTTIADTKTKATQAFEEAPKESRKDFAIWVRTNHPELGPYLFALLDERDIEPLIYKTVDWQEHQESPNRDAE